MKETRREQWQQERSARAVCVICFLYGYRKWDSWPVEKKNQGQEMTGVGAKSSGKERRMQLMVQVEEELS